MTDISPVLLPIRYEYKMSERWEVYSFWIFLIAIEVQAPPGGDVRVDKDRSCPAVGVFLLL